MATKKEEKLFEKERKAAIKARYKRMKEEGIENYLTPEQISIIEIKKGCMVCYIQILFLFV